MRDRPLAAVGMIGMMASAASLAMRVGLDTIEEMPRKSKPRRKAGRKKVPAAPRRDMVKEQRRWMIEKPDGRAATRRRRQREVREARDAFMAAGASRKQARRMAWEARQAVAAS
ncbi:hypothetical protein [Hyphobacterium sp.]|uniref:hypothetical protein n=1 Tax=Hyphobacterium sp. TaxID=2004662 RepID=UPI003BA96C6A